MLRAADVFLENGVFIETGPHKHAIQQTFFLYVYEPGGNRVEVASAGARLILAPDWKPIRWTEAERKKGQAWGLQDHRVVPHPRHAAGAGRAEVVTAAMNECRSCIADRALVAALANGDAGAAAALFDDDFTWVDCNGRILDKAKAAGALPKPPLGDEAGLAQAIQDYGEVVTIVVDRDKVFVLRLWVKRAPGWRAASSTTRSRRICRRRRTGPAARNGTIPATRCPIGRAMPTSATALPPGSGWRSRSCITSRRSGRSTSPTNSWWCGAARRHSKADRKAVLAEQRRSGANSAPAPLVSARLFGFNDAIVMSCEHQPFHGKARARLVAYSSSATANWLMAVSFQTTPARAPEVENDFRE